MKFKSYINTLFGVYYLWKWRYFQGRQARALEVTKIIKGVSDANQPLNNISGAAEVGKPLNFIAKIGAGNGI